MTSYNPKVKRQWIFAFFLLFLASCDTNPPAKKVRIAFSQCCGDPWRKVMEREMLRELAFHPEVDFTIRTAGNNSKTQTEQIQELVRTGVDLLIVSPNESEPLTPIVESVFAKGIPVVLIDRKTESDQFTAYVGANNYEIGQTTAKYIANKFEGGGHIVELQLGLTMSAARERSQGFRSELANHPNLNLAAQLELTGSMDQLKSDLLKTLLQHPEIKIVFGHSDFIAESAFDWVMNAGLPAKDMFFVGIDGIPGLGQGIQAVEDGILDASLLYPTGGSEAIRLSLAILNNLPFEKNNILQTIVINEDNARMLHLQMKKEESLQRSIEEQEKGLDKLKNIYQNQRSFILILVFTLLLAMLLGGILWKNYREKVKINKDLEIKTREALEHEAQVLKISDELRDATQAKVDFFTNISHEFRTPLTLILGYIEGLLNPENNQSESKQHLGLVRKNALRLLRLVNQLMDFRKIESGKMQVRASENDLVEFVRGIVDAYRQMAQKAGIELVFISVEKPLPAWFDGDMLDKVLFNLLSNAFKFTAKGGKIQVGISKNAISQLATIQVEDTGSGMTKEQVEHAFERFYQGNSGKFGGTGLGLSLSQELMHLHGGKIEVFSEFGKGTRFEVSLQLGRAHFRDEQIVANQGTLAANTANEYLSSLFDNEGLLTVATGVSHEKDKNRENTLLVIEDNDEMRQFLINHFGKTYHILEAPNGEAGLEMAFEEVPDLIIADIMMPGKNGLELTRILKTDLRTSHIPVVLLTARNTIDQKIEGIQTGADAYLTKPFNLVFLSEIVKNLLHNREKLRALFSNNLNTISFPTEIGSLDRQFLEKFVQYIETHFADQNLSVERLSTEFGLSRVHLFRKTKALLGDSPNNLIQEVRLKNAADLLLAGQLTISEIAYQTGYSSPGYFSTAFRGKYQCSPSDWREKNR